MKLKRPAKRHKYSSEAIVLIQVCIVIALILFRYVYQPLIFRQQSLIYSLSCVLSALAVWCFFSWYLLTKSLFNPYTMFFLSALLFNGGQALLEAFHLNENGLGNWYLGDDLPYLSTEDIISTLYLVIIGLSTFHLGALISLVTTKKAKINKIKSNLNSDLSSNSCYVVGMRLFFISLLPTIYILRQTISVVLSSGYFGLYQQEAATSFSAAPAILSDFLIPGSIFILAGSKNKPKGRWISVTAVLLYAMIRFFLGQRNQAIMPLIALAWLWHILIKPLPKAFLLGVGSFMVLIVFPLVALTRNTTGGNRLSLEYLQQTFSSIDNPFIAFLSEMGASMLTVAYTIDIVPKEREFQLGAEYLYALLTVIPNFFGNLHPTVARGIPTHWLTEQINPYIASINGSYGYSFIAEAYLNFGWIGAPIALGIMGFALVKLILWAVKSRNPGKMAMIATFTSYFLFYARAESTMIVRPLVWYCFLPYLAVRYHSNSVEQKNST